VECESAKNGKWLAWINAIHAKLKNFLSKFWGIRMKHLQLYLNWFMHIADWTYLCFESKLTNIKSIFQGKFINYSMNC
jgi:transposase-like protein